jgi:hypothetical protein
VLRSRREQTRGRCPTLSRGRFGQRGKWGRVRRLIFGLGAWMVTASGWVLRTACASISRSWFLVKGCGRV